MSELGFGGNINASGTTQRGPTRGWAGPRGVGLMPPGSHLPIVALGVRFRGDWRSGYGDVQHGRLHPCLRALVHVHRVRQELAAVPLHQEHHPQGACAQAGALVRVPSLRASTATQKLRIVTLRFGTEQPSRESFVSMGGRCDQTRGRGIQAYDGRFKDIFQEVYEVCVMPRQFRFG
jgi:hypothetical protein